MVILDFEASAYGGLIWVDRRGRGTGSWWMGGADPGGAVSLPKIPGSLDGWCGVANGWFLSQGRDRSVSPIRSL